MNPIDIPQVSDSRIIPTPTGNADFEAFRQSLAVQLIADITAKLATDIKPIAFTSWLSGRMYEDACDIAHAQRAAQNTPDKHGMTRDDRMAAYAAIKTRYNLKHRQRTALDEAPHYGVIIGYAHKGDWAAVESYLKEDKILTA